MRKTTFILIFVYILSHTGMSVRAQDSINKPSRASFYLELGGLAMIASLNLDMRITDFTKHNLGCRFGIGYPLITGLITTVNYIYGQKRHFLEIGAGGVYIPGIHPVSYLAYRFQCLRNPLVLRLVLTHVFMEAFDSDDLFYPWGGISIGCRL